MRFQQCKDLFKQKKNILGLGALQDLVSITQWKKELAGAGDIRWHEQRELTF